MSFMKLDIVCSDLGKNGPRLFHALVLVGEADEDFIVPGFSDQAPIPTRIGKIVQHFWLLLFLHRVGVPGADKENEVVGDPVGASQIGRVLSSFRRGFLQNQPLLVNLVDISRPNSTTSAMVLPPRASVIARAASLSEVASTWLILIPGNRFSNKG